MRRVLFAIGAALIGGGVTALILHSRAKKTEGTDQTEEKTTTAPGRIPGAVQGTLPLQSGAGLNLQGVPGAPTAAQPVPGDPIVEGSPGTLLWATSAARVKA